MDEDAAIAWLAGKPVFDFKPVVAVNRFRQQMASRRAETDEHPVADNETVGRVRVRVLGRHVRLPSG